MRVENYRRYIAEAAADSPGLAGGGGGVLFLLQHFEHPTAAVAAIRRSHPGLRFLVLTINLWGRDSETGRSECIMRLFFEQISAST